MTTDGYCLSCKTRWYWTRDVSVYDFDRNATCATCESPLVPLAPGSQRGEIAVPHPNGRLWIDDKPRRDPSREPTDGNVLEALMSMVICHAGRFNGTGRQSTTIVADVLDDLDGACHEVSIESIWAAMRTAVRDGRLEARESNGITGYRVNYRRTEFIEELDGTQTARDDRADAGGTTMKTTKKIEKTAARKTAAKRTVTKKTAAKKSTTKKVAAKKPTTKKAGAMTKADTLRAMFTKSKTQSVEGLLKSTKMDRHNLHSTMAALRNAKKPEAQLDATLDRDRQVYVLKSMGGKAKK